MTSESTTPSVNKHLHVLMTHNEKHVLPERKEHKQEMPAVLLSLFAVSVSPCVNRFAETLLNTLDTSG